MADFHHPLAPRLFIGVFNSDPVPHLYHRSIDLRITRLDFSPLNHSMLAVLAAPIGAANRLDREVPQDLQKLFHTAFGIQSEARPPTSPEPPTYAFQRPLAPQIVVPLLGRMVLVPVQLDSKTVVVVTLHNQVDRVGPSGNLRRHAVSQLRQPPENVSLESGLTVGDQSLLVRVSARHGVIEVCDYLGLQVIRVEARRFDASNQIHAIPGAGECDVESLLRRAGRLRGRSGWTGHHAHEHD